MQLEFINLNSPPVVVVNCDNYKAMGKEKWHRTWLEESTKNDNIEFRKKTMAKWKSNLKSTGNATRCSNRDDLLHLTLLWKFQYFWKPIYNPVKHLMEFLLRNSKPLSIFTKSSIVDIRLGSKYVSAFWRLFKRFISLKYFTL